MILADYLEYRPLKGFYQGSSKMCATYSALGNLIEVIQQKFNLDVEFDFATIHNQMEAWRRQNKTPHGKTYTRYSALMWIGYNEGFKDTEGRLWKIGTWYKINKFNSTRLMYAIQAHGPILVGVKIFKYHDMTAPIIEDVPENPVVAVLHGEYLRGFDKESETFIIQDSRTRNTYKQYIPFNVLEDVWLYAYVFYDVTQVK